MNGWIISKPDKVDLGSGKRAIVKDGVYVPRYQITVPRALEAPHERSL